MLVWKLWTVYTGMFAVTAILSCVIKIRGLFKSTKCGRLKMSNLKLSQPGVNNRVDYMVYIRQAMNSPLERRKRRPPHYPHIHVISIQVLILLTALI